MSPRVVVMASIVLGAGCLVAAAVSYSQETARLAIPDTGKQVTGQVTAARVSRGEKGRLHHYITYRYTVGDRTHTSGECRISYPLKEGTPIQVWYDANRPDRCISAPERQRGREMLWVIVWGLLGACLVGGGVIGLARGA